MYTECVYVYIVFQRCALLVSVCEENNSQYPLVGKLGGH